MDWTNWLAKLFLAFSHVSILVPFLTIGFLAINRKLFGHATLLLLFTIILNAYLKAIFKIPLAPHLQKVGYAFPSGHMHTTIVFYGWLFLNMHHQLIRSLLIILMAGIGYFLIQQGYHNWLDISGGIAFGFLSLLIYIPLTRMQAIQARPFIAGFLCWILAACLVIHNPTLPAHVLMAWITLGSFTLSWFISNPPIQTTSTVLAAIIGCMVLATVYGMYLTTRLHAHTSYYILCSFLGFRLPLAARLITSKVAQ